MSSDEATPPFEDLVATLKKTVATLRDSQIPYVLGGGLAIWARGGPESDHDLDFMVKREDADDALAALVEAGMKAERPPENWLYKAYDGNGVLVDLIFEPKGNPVDDELIERGSEREVLAITVRVMAPEDVLVSKLLALHEQDVDYHALLQITRAVREQVDWEDVRARTADSVFARAFFTLAEGLDLVEPATADAASGRARAAS